MENREKLQRELLELLQAQEQNLKYNRFSTYYPMTGPFRKDLYKVHCEFMNAGDKYMERALFGGNGTGKTKCGAYEMTCHLTGLYPEWWEGRRFDQPISAWCVGFSNDQVKRVMQYDLLGELHDIGSGMVPKNLIEGRPRMKAGVSDTVGTFFVRHVTGGLSKCAFLAAEQGREAFQGTSINVVWEDEELKNIGIHSECIARLRDPIRPGIIYSTFTPLLGLSDIALSFFPGGIYPEGGINPENPFKFCRKISVYDVPHLTKEYIEHIKNTYSPHEMRARLFGEPSLGSGAIYPTYMEEDIFVDPIPIPDWWPRAYGMDVGWNKTAAVWGAMNPDTREIFIYSEHYQGKEAPAVHASAIKARGAWIIGAIDVASKGSSQADGQALHDLYEAEGLQLVKERISPEAGILKIYQAFVSGQLKIFKTCVNLQREFRVYRRDENGKIIKEKDHALDALRYFMMLGLDHMDVEPDPDFKPQAISHNYTRDEITGY